MTRSTASSSRRLAAVALAWLLGCGASPSATSALRFFNRDPVWRVHDRASWPKPTERVTGTWRVYVNTRVSTPILRSLEFRSPTAATDVNALGGVPDSTWFQNRIGVRDMTLQEIANGAPGLPPDMSAPFIAVERTGPATLLAKDARGRNYELRFDPEGLPELETAAEVVVSRLLWAAGYNVASNTLVCVRREDFVLGPDEQRDVDAMFALTPKASGRGCFRAVATDELPGKPIDAFAANGVRGDDPNDRVPHQQRRALRGAAVFYAWVGNTSMQERNTLDVWIESPLGSGRGYLVHYLHDFGRSFGAGGLSQRHEHDGFTPHFDVGSAVGSLFGFGLWERPWESVTAPGLLGVGRYEAAHFDPGGWSPQESYQAFSAIDRFDEYWAATILARIRPEQVAAAVAEGQYSDGWARAYLIRTLLARQRKLVEHAFSRVTPLDDFTLKPTAAGFRLCATDLMLASALATPEHSHYLARAYDEVGDAFDGWRELDALPSGSLCVDGVHASEAADGYTMLALTTWRDGLELPPVIVHMALVPRTRVLRIVGVERR